MNKPPINDECGQYLLSALVKFGSIATGPGTDVRVYFQLTQCCFADPMKIIAELKMGVGLFHDSLYNLR